MIKLNLIRIVDYSTKAKNTTPAERRRQGSEDILRDSDVQFVYWTEAEKPDLLTSENLARVGKAIQAGNAVIIPTAKPNDDRPDYMKAIEMRAIRRAFNIIENSWKMGSSRNFKDKFQWDPYVEPKEWEKFYDLWFGPFVVNRDVATQYVTTYHGQIWDWNIVPKAEAIVDWHASTFLPVNFQYPPEQKAQEEENKDQWVRYRKKQYRIILRQLMKHFQQKNNPS